MADEEFDMVRSFRNDQVFHLPDVGYSARFEIGQQILQAVHHLRFSLALRLIVRIVVQETQVIVSMLPERKLQGFHTGTPVITPAGGACPRAQPFFYLMSLRGTSNLSLS